MHDRATLRTVVEVMSAADNPARSSVAVAKFKMPPTIDANWDKAAWQDALPILVGRHMGSLPTHYPRTVVKVGYDDAALYVIFRVDDRYVRSVADRHQGSVCKDSCVEFFFTPGTDISVGYFNIEMNCGGTTLFHFQKKPRDGVEIPMDELDRIEIAHTLPTIVDPAIDAPVVWSVEYRIPTSILAKYCDVARPERGVTWRGNFYKCGDETSHPHWLSWNLVDNPTPNFHLPEFFGTIEFI
jgi:hypothetical protein